MRQWLKGEFQVSEWSFPLFDLTHRSKEQSLIVVLSLKELEMNELNKQGQAK